MKTLAGQTTLILGLGASGLSMARWCARLGAHVIVLDNRETPPELGALERDVPSARFMSADFDAVHLDALSVRAVFKSPGLSPAQIAPLWSAAQKKGLYTGGELSLFARALQDLRQEQDYCPKVVAITGSNGKTTVTAMTGLLLEHAGLNVAVAGNIGPALLDTLTGHLAAGSLPQAWVLELSSFQLDSLNIEDGFVPDAATILNISEDHLDWHGSMEQYAKAKAAIWAYPQTVRIANDDDAMTRELVAMATSYAKHLAVDSVQATAPNSTKTKSKNSLAKTPIRTIRFGSHAPECADQFGLERQADMSWLAYCPRSLDGGQEQRALQRLMPAAALRIQGQHNALNALAALGLCVAIGQNMAPLLHGLREYRGEPHRVESIGVHADVEYFDDSKGTNVGATLAALQGLGQERKIVLIAGGQGKGQNFAPLAQAVQRYTRAVVLMGQDAALIEASLAEAAVSAHNVALHHAADMQEAVACAAAAAQTGDAVLLSPACASLDMYRDYKHRGHDFAQAVARHFNEQGGL